MRRLLILPLLLIAGTAGAQMVNISTGVVGGLYATSGTWSTSSTDFSS